MPDDPELMALLRDMVESDVATLVKGVSEPIELSAVGYGQYLAYQAVLSYMTGLQRTPSPSRTES
jgi:hypothetical protein